MQALRLRIPDFLDHPGYSEFMMRAVISTHQQFQAHREIYTLRDIFVSLVNARLQYTYEIKDDGYQANRVRPNMIFRWKENFPHKFHPFTPIYAENLANNYGAFRQEAVSILGGRTSTQRTLTETVDGGIKVSAELTNIVNSKIILKYLGFEYDSSAIFWLHPNYVNMMALAKIADFKFRDFLKNLPTLNKKQVLERIAEIHFILANAQIITRGNAAVSDGISKLLLLEAHLPIGMWKPGLSPDISAFHLSKEEFIAAYESFFETSPLKEN